MGQQYNQLTLKERYQIQALKELSISAREIGRRLGRSNRTISSELSRLPKGEYCAELAQQNYETKVHSAAKSTKVNQKVEDIVNDALKIDFSPEQIAGRMALEHAKLAVSFQTIYRLIKRRDWRSRLPRGGKPYRPRKDCEAGAKLIPNRVDIDERPAHVDLKEEVGHWEGDTVYGQDGYFVTLVERVSKAFLTKRVKNKKKETVSRAILQLLKPYKSMVKTITFDNGGEFADHQRIAKVMKCEIYFAKPYHSWQRGLNENTNGLLRRYCPKGKKISQFTEQQIKLMQSMINIRPRKTLNYLNPCEFLMGKRVSLMLEI